MHFVIVRDFIRVQNNSLHIVRRINPIYRTLERLVNRIPVAIATRNGIAGSRRTTRPADYSVGNIAICILIVSKHGACQIYSSFAHITSPLTRIIRCRITRGRFQIIEISRMSTCCRRSNGNLMFFRKNRVACGICYINRDGSSPRRHCSDQAVFIDRKHFSIAALPNGTCRRCILRGQLRCKLRGFVRLDAVRAADRNSCRINSSYNINYKYSCIFFTMYDFDIFCYTFAFDCTAILSIANYFNCIAIALPCF